MTLTGKPPRCKACGANAAPYQDYVTPAGARRLNVLTPEALAQALDDEGRTSTTRQRNALLDDHLSRLPWARWSRDERADYLLRMLHTPLSGRSRHGMGFASQRAARHATSRADMATRLQLPQFIASLGPSLHAEALQHQQAGIECQLAGKWACASRAFATASRLQKQVAGNTPAYRAMLTQWCHAAAQGMGEEATAVRIFARLIKDTASPPSAKLCAAMFSAFSRVLTDLPEVGVPAEEAAQTLERLVRGWRYICANCPEKNLSVEARASAYTAQQALSKAHTRLAPMIPALAALSVPTPFQEIASCTGVQRYIEDLAHRDIAISDFGPLAPAIRAFGQNALRANPAAGGRKRNLLLTGPSGSGKTERVRAMAKGLCLPLLNVDAGDLVSSRYMGDATKAVANLYGGARALAEERGKPVIVFLDEFDALGGHRSEGPSEGSAAAENDRIVTQFLRYTDTNADNLFGKVITVAATNNPRALDKALRKRFVVEEVPLPSAHILSLHCKKFFAKHKVEVSDDEAAMCGRWLERFDLRTAYDLMGSALEGSREWLKKLRVLVERQGQAGRPVTLVRGKEIFCGVSLTREGTLPALKAKEGWNLGLADAGFDKGDPYKAGMPQLLSKAVLTEEGYLHVSAVEGLPGAKISASLYDVDGKVLPLYEQGRLSSQAMEHLEQRGDLWLELSLEPA